MKNYFHELQTSVIELQQLHIDLQNIFIWTQMRKIEMN